MEYNGVAPGVGTSKEVDPIQFKSEDDPAVETIMTATAPLVRPNAGVFRSYEKYIAAYLDALGGSAEISNIEAFISGTTPTNGIAIRYKTEAAYTEPLAGGYDAGGAMIGPTFDLFDTDSDNPVDLGAGPFNTELANAGDYLVMQMEVRPSAEVGETAGFSLVLRYDEA